MDENKIMKELSKTRKPRAPLYLNGDSLNLIFPQYVGAISGLVRSGKLGAEVSASLLNFFGSKLSAEEVLSATVDLSPTVKGVLIEAHARDSNDLVDLTSSDPKQDTWLTYIGDAKFIRRDQILTQEYCSFSPSIVETIQKERELQEQDLKEEDESIKTTLWLAESRGYILASIASTKGIISNVFASYARKVPQGILGRLERMEESVVFVAPFWIWSEGW
ncbi:MAG: hypothetical protein J7K30_14695 [Deltaproteobacteria bacterium]|nr:hypothetical protein [Deltaproteobacteria bacterium]